MTKSALVRPILQLLSVFVFAAWFVSASTSPVYANDQACREYASACAAKCGSEWSEYIASYVYNPYHELIEFCIFHEDTQEWESCWVGELEPIYNWTFGAAVDEFTCDEVDPWDSICMCRY